MDKGTWWATSHGVSKSQTQLNDSKSQTQLNDYHFLTFHFISIQGKKEKYKEGQYHAPNPWACKWQIGLKHRGSGSDAHLGYTPVGSCTCTQATVSAVVGTQRCSCTRHITADFSSHWHSCQAWTRPPQGTCQPVHGSHTPLTHTLHLLASSPPQLTSHTLFPDLQILKITFPVSCLFHFGSTEAQMGAVPSAITVCSTDDFYSIPGCIFGIFVVVDATPVKDSHQAFCDWITLF